MCNIQEITFGPQIYFIFYYKIWSIYKRLHSMMNNNTTNVHVTVIHIIERKVGGGKEGGTGREKRDSCNGSSLKDRFLLSLGNHCPDCKSSLPRFALGFYFLCFHHLCVLHISTFLMIFPFISIIHLEFIL